MKSERERQIPHGITYIENLKYNEHIYKIKTGSQTQTEQINRQREYAYGCQGGEGRIRRLG